MKYVLRWMEQPNLFVGIQQILPHPPGYFGCFQVSGPREHWSARLYGKAGLYARRLGQQEKLCIPGNSTDAYRQVFPQQFAGWKERRLGYRTIGGRIC
jgi:hypothetical protein